MLLLLALLLQPSLLAPAEAARQAQRRPDTCTAGTTCTACTARLYCRRDMWYGLDNLRAHASTHMQLEAFHWLKAHHPYW